MNLSLGILYALTAGILWGIGPLLLKKGMTVSNVSAATLIEQYMAVLTVAVFAALSGELSTHGLNAAAFWSFAAAGAVGASFGKIFYYKAIDKIGASKSTSIKNSSPVLTVILAVVLLGEELTIPVVAGVALIVIGIFVISHVEAKGGARPDRMGYFLYPLLAALCFGFNPIFKKIGIESSAAPTLGALITQSTALLVMLSAGRFLKIKPKWERVPTRSLVLFVVAGVTEALGSLFTFYALIHAPTVIVSPVWRISPLVTFALARATLKGIEVVTLRDGLAAAFIVGGVFVLARG
jgi:transporter family protein